MGTPIKRIFKTVTKQAPDVVNNVTTAARVPVQSVKTVTPTSISTTSITDVFPNQTVTNRLGIPIGIGSDVMFDNGKLVGTIFSGDKRYDLSKLYDDFENVGISDKKLNNWLYTTEGFEDFFTKLPLNANFHPDIRFTVGTRNPISFNAETYIQLMRSAGYNDNHIKYILGNNYINLLNGKPITFPMSLKLNDKYKPYTINKDNYDFFRPEHIIENMDDDMAENIFYRAMFSQFNPSEIDLDSNKVVFSSKLREPHPVLIKASEKLSQKYPEFNFDPSLIQFTPAYSGDNIPTINFWRQRHSVLPFDFDLFSWGQGKINPKSFGVRGERPKTGWDVYKSLGKLYEGVPRGYAMTEVNTSPDSESLKLAMARKNYGTSPKQTTIKVVDSNASRNTQQNNAIWLEDLLNNPSIPQSERLKLMEIQKNGGIKGVNDEWLDSETFKQAKVLFNQKAIPDMYKLYRGWHELKKIDPNIGDFKISTEPFNKDDLDMLFRTGRVAPKIYSPDFHIIRNKNGGKLLKHWNLAVQRLKNNNKFGN